MIGKFCSECGLEQPDREDKSEPAEVARKLRRLRTTVAWILTDASYKAPEHIDAEMVGRWLGSLREAFEETKP